MLAAEVGLLEGEGGAELVEAVALQFDGGGMKHRGGKCQGQPDGRMVISREGGSDAGGQMDIQQCIDMHQSESNVDMHSTQGGWYSGADPDVGAEPALHSFTECVVPSVSLVGPLSDHLSMAINQSIPKAAAATIEEMLLNWRRI